MIRYMQTDLPVHRASVAGNLCTRISLGHQNLAFHRLTTMIYGPPAQLVHSSAEISNAVQQEAPQVEQLRTFQPFNTPSKGFSMSSFPTKGLSNLTKIARSFRSSRMMNPEFHEFLINDTEATRINVIEQLHVQPFQSRP